MVRLNRFSHSSIALFCAVLVCLLIPSARGAAAPERAAGQPFVSDNPADASVAFVSPRNDPPQSQVIAGQLIVKLKEGVDPAAVSASVQAFAVENVFLDYPGAEETLSRLKEELGLLAQQHERWYWQLDPNSAEYKAYMERAAREKGALQGRIKAQEQLVERLNRRSAKASRPVPDLKNIYLLRVDPAADVRELARQLNGHPAVVYAQPNFMYRLNLAQLPNDTYVNPSGDGTSWSSGTWQQPYADLWGWQKIKAHKAWPVNQGRDVLVAVVDTGVDYNHPELLSRIWVDPALVSDSNGDGSVTLADCDTNANGKIDPDEIREHMFGWDFVGVDVYDPIPDKDPADDVGHGTHCAGTIAAAGNNRQGIVGVAPEARILPIRALTADGGDTPTLANALRYAADHYADVISNSWGGYGVDPLIEEAVAYCLGKGCVVIASAGNDQVETSCGSLTAVDGVLTVASADQNGRKTYFSNWGLRTDVAAPGGSCNWEIVRDPRSHGGAYAVTSADKEPTFSFSVWKSFEETRLFIHMNYGPRGGTVLYTLKRWDAASSAYVVHSAGSIDLRSDTEQFDVPYELVIPTGSFMCDMTLQGTDADSQISLDRIVFGPKVYEEEYWEGSLNDKYATGRNILSLRAKGTNIYRDTKGLVSEEYCRAAGTSMACPHVSGLAALIVSKHPEFDVEQVNAVIKASCDDIERDPGWDPRTGAGMVNVERALAINEPCIARFSNLIRGSHVKGMLAVRGTASGAAFKRYTVSYRKQSYFEPVQWNVLVTSASAINDGVLGQIDTRTLEGDGQMYEFELKVEDTAGFVFQDHSFVYVDQRVKDGWPVMAPLWFRPPIVADMDHNGENEVIIKTFSEVGRFSPTGRLLANEPLDLSVLGIINSYSQLRIGDMDADADLEYILESYTDTRLPDGKWVRRCFINVFHHNGTLLPGWPVEVVTSTPHIVVADVAGDRGNEVVVQAGNKVYVLTAAGQSVAGSPFDAGEIPLNGSGVGDLAVGDIDHDGTSEIIAGIGSSLFALRVNAEGRLVKLWDRAVPVPAGEKWFLRHVLIGDLNGDGPKEIVAALNYDEKIYAYTAAGNLLPGWPVAGQADVFDLILGDLDNDGGAEVVCGETSTNTNEYHIAAWKSDGTVLSGWPVTMAPETSPYPWGAAVVDLDGDGFKEVVTRTWDAKIRAFDRFGNPVDGFPLSGISQVGNVVYSGWTFPEPLTVADIDGDGKTDIVATFGHLYKGPYTGRIMVWGLEGTYRKSGMEWPMSRSNPGGSNCWNNPDVTAPTGSVSINGGAAFTASRSVTLTLVAEDDGSGMGQDALMRFLSEGGSWSAPEPFAGTKQWQVSAGWGEKSVSVQFCDANGNWSLTYSDTIVLDETPPPVPVFAAQGQLETAPGLYAEWSCNDPESGIDEFTYRITESNPLTGRVVRDWSSAGTDTRVDATGLDLVSGRRYYFAIQARNGAGVFSDTVYSAAILWEDTAQIPAPQELTAVQAQGSIVLSWRDASGNEEGFRIERSFQNGDFTALASVGADVQTWTDPSVETGYYRYRVYAFAGSRVSEFSNEASVSFQQIPWPPSRISAAGLSESEIEVTWDVEDGNPVAGVRVERSENGIDGFAQIADVPRSDRFTDDTLGPGMIRYYRIRFYNDAGISAYSAVVSARTQELADTTPPTTPLVQDAGDVTDRLDSLDIVWSSQDPETGIAEYSYQIREGDPFSGPLVRDWTSAGSMTELTITGLELEMGKSYYCGVKAKNGAGLWSEVGFSDGITVIGSSLLEAPSELEGEVVRDRQILLRWRDNSASEEGFLIERSNNNHDFDCIGLTRSDSVQFTNIGILNDRQYYYRVRAYRSGGYSGYSNTAAVFVVAKPIPQRPTDIAVRLEEGALLLSWRDNSPDEEGFMIERSVDQGGFMPMATVAADVRQYLNHVRVTGRYRYRLRAYNQNGESDYSEEAETFFSGVPRAALYVAAEGISVSQVQVQWVTEVDNPVTGVKLERSLSPESGFAQIADVPLGGVFTDAGLDAETAYYYRVRFYNALGVSAYSRAVRAQTHAVTDTTPGQVTSVRDAGEFTESISGLSASFTAEDLESGVIGYQYRIRTGSIDGPVINDWRSVDRQPNRGVTVVLSGLQLAVGQTYYFEVQARNGAGLLSDPAFSDGITVKLDSVLQAPEDLEATAHEDGSVRLGWKDRSDNEQWFRIERATDGISFWWIATAAADASSFTDTTVRPHTTYQYRVCAFNTRGSSSYSNVAFVESR